MITTIANQKGGSGKSTLAINIATRLLEQSKKVLLLDTDSQKNCESFTNIRESEENKERNLPYFTLSNRSGDITQSLKQSLELYEYIVIDTKGSDCVESRKAMLYADRLIIPTTPSQLDFDVLCDFLERVKEVRDFNENLKVYVLINKVSPNPFLSKELSDFKEAIFALCKESSINDIHICENIIYDKIAYKRAISEGLGINEYSDDKAKQKFEEVFSEIMN
ncbi:ParA family protein [Helicobacter sp. MIT 21-1697]|uniref:ParA family protein n=1 Tax=Helicobacter sp. MIT 21-1697 TaxID=2993733 RepID=UPI00224A708D|nr:ParA family protein [Helicobacter sp. MIT 21-1697]MCX2716815.1 ParA family protein [Helicobacter sp. MIT 21-1697]